MRYLFNEMSSTKRAQSYGNAGVNQDASVSIEAVSFFARALSGNTSVYRLSDSEFADIAYTSVKENWAPIQFSNGEKGFAVQVSTYSSPWGLAIGRGTLYLNSDYGPVGFYDRYDPNPQAVGARTVRNEVFTTLLRASGASEFSICYGRVSASRVGSC